MEDVLRISILIIFLLLASMTTALRVFCLALLRPHIRNPASHGHGFRILFYQNIAQLLFSIGFIGLIALSFTSPPDDDPENLGISLAATFFFLVCLGANFAGAWYGLKMLITRPPEVPAG